MYALKNLVGSLLMPLPVAVLLALIGLLLVRRQRRAGLLLTLLGCLLGLAACWSPVARALLEPLESQYPAVLNAGALAPPPRFVVVLGAGAQEQAGWPITAELTPTSLVRLAEGLRLLRQLGDARLIVSGGSAHGQLATARGYAQAAEALGVAATRLIINDTPLDTRAEIRNIRAEVADAPVLLVTSAAHMPRAMAYCRKYGVRAIAAPTGYLAQPAARWDLLAFLPTSSALQKSETALHEYLGLLSLRWGGP